MNEMKILSETEEAEVNGGLLSYFARGLGRAIRNFLRRPVPNRAPDFGPSFWER